MQYMSKRLYDYDLRLYFWRMLVLLLLGLKLLQQLVILKLEKNQKTGINGYQNYVPIMDTRFCLGVIGGYYDHKNMFLQQWKNVRLLDEEFAPRRAHGKMF